MIIIQFRAYQLGRIQSLLFSEHGWAIGDAGDENVQRLRASSGLLKLRKKQKRATRKYASGNPFAKREERKR